MKRIDLLRRLEEEGCVLSPLCRVASSVWRVLGGPKEIGMMVYMRESGISASRSDRAMCVLSQ